MFLLSVLSTLETDSELMESFIVLASSCLLHFKVPTTVLNFQKCSKIVKESDYKALLLCYQHSPFTCAFRKDTLNLIHKAWYEKEAYMPSNKNVAVSCSAIFFVPWREYLTNLACSNKMLPFWGTLPSAPVCSWGNWCCSECTGCRETHICLRKPIVWHMFSSLC